MAQIAAERESAQAATGGAGTLGLSALALTTFVFSAFNAGWVAAAGLGVIAGIAFFYGGLAQFVSGIWEHRAGNTFGSTMYVSLGAFWFSFAALLIPTFGGGMSSLPRAALGIYLLAWAIFTLLLFVASLRTNLVTMVLTLLLTLTLLTLGLTDFGMGLGLLGGYLGVLTALVAWYAALAGLLASTRGMFSLPTWPR